MKNEIMHDSIVIGIRDNALSECLQMDINLTLEKVKNMSGNLRQPQEQQFFLKNGDHQTSEMPIDYVHTVGFRKAQKHY